MDSSSSAAEISYGWNGYSCIIRSTKTKEIIEHGEGCPSWSVLISGALGRFTAVQGKWIFECYPVVSLAKIFPIIQMMDILRTISIPWFSSTMIRLNMHLVDHDLLFVTQINVSSSSLFRSGKRWKRLISIGWAFLWLSLSLSLVLCWFQSKGKSKPTIFFLSGVYFLCLSLSRALVAHNNNLRLLRSQYLSIVYSSGSRVHISIEKSERQRERERKEREILNIEIDYKSTWLFFFLFFFSRLIWANLHKEKTRAMMRHRCKVDWKIEASFPTRAVIS